MSMSENAEIALRTAILYELKKVNQKNAPKIYEKIKTDDGYKWIEQRIINMVIIDGITPSACIPQIEAELL